MKELKELTIAVICEDCDSIPSCCKDRRVPNTSITFCEADEDAYHFVELYLEKA
jgi:hypothetical protein